MFLVSCRTGWTLAETLASGANQSLSSKSLSPCLLSVITPLRNRLDHHSHQDVSGEIRDQTQDDYGSITRPVSAKTVDPLFWLDQPLVVHAESTANVPLIASFAAVPSFFPNGPKGSGRSLNWQAKAIELYGSRSEGNPSQKGRLFSLIQCDLDQCSNQGLWKEFEPTQPTDVDVLFIVYPAALELLIGGTKFSSPLLK